jgi:hypothetical protein
MYMTLKSFGFLQTPRLLVRDFVTIDPHHTLLGTAVADEIDAAVPNGFEVNNGKFLMNVRFEN